MNIVTVKERPIVFTADSVQAIFEGRKVQTRRVIKFPRHALMPNASWIKSIHQDGGGNWVAWSDDAPGLAEFTRLVYPRGNGFPCPYGVPGDRLWVQETSWCFGHFEPTGNLTETGRPEMAFVWNEDFNSLVYAADGSMYLISPYLDPRNAWHKRPSIFMPRWASRLNLEIISVKVQRVQNISEEDVFAEGVGVETPGGQWFRIQAPDVAIEHFARTWNEINEKRGYGWDANPWVWCLTFKRIMA